MARLSGKGKGKWQSMKTLNAYRLKRNRQRRLAAAARRKNSGKR